MLKENKEDWLTRMQGLHIKGKSKVVIFLLYLLLALWLILFFIIYV